MITSLVRKEFWRVFPAGTATIQPDDGAAVAGAERARSGAQKRERRSK
jgi:hypothetical protein